MKTLREMRRDLRLRFTREGFSDARTEADVLLAGALDSSRSDIELGALLGRSVTSTQAARVAVVAERRLRREPLQHILGTAPFRGLDLAVGPGVFVPRPETELLVEYVLEILGPPRSDGSPLRIADLGSGSGAIALGIATARPDTHVQALEGSARAWPWLRENVRRFGDGRVTPVFGRIGAALTNERNFDLIVSNPPYIPEKNIPATPEVRLYDPPIALYGGVDGLDPIREILPWATRALRPGHHLLLEHDDHQAPGIRALFVASGWQEARSLRDLNERDRVTLACTPTTIM